MKQKLTPLILLLAPGLLVLTLFVGFKTHIQDLIFERVISRRAVAFNQSVTRAEFEQTKVDQVQYGGFSTAHLAQAPNQFELLDPPHSQNCVCCCAATFN